MPPHRVSSAENTQTPEQIAQTIVKFLASHAQAALVEDGKVLFELSGDAAAPAKYELSTAHGSCTLHLWSEERNTVRRIVSATERAGTLRLATLRFGQTQTKLLELVADRKQRTPATREGARVRYLRLLERLLERSFPEWKVEGLRAAMDLERSFGPAYARGSLVRGQQAWAVIGVNAEESVATIDGILTLGILWLEQCREQAAGRRLYQGLKVVVPRGTSALTLSRIAWLNHDAARWELYELDERDEELTAQDAADQGNLRTRLVRHPDEAAARERFAPAVQRVLDLVPDREHNRVEQRLRSASELAFLLHGLEFARVRLGYGDKTFAQTLEVSVGVGASETVLTRANRESLAGMVAELFRRRRADSEEKTTDPLFRAAPERWLESVLRQDLAPLTRHLGPQPASRHERASGNFANEADPDTIGNRADPEPSASATKGAEPSRVIPRFDARHVYAQVPAIAGAKDRGMLDLLGVTADGRLAVIELKADEDLHLALQGLDYWIRVRHHHLQSADARSGLGEFQRHGYFRGVELSPLPPRLYLVAPALRIHPATEIILRYFSPRVEWNLLALDERWRSKVRVVWRKQSGQ